VELSVRPEAITLVPADAIGALRGAVEQAAYLGATVSYQIRTTGGLALSVLAPKTGVRLPVGSEVAVAWAPTEALVLGRGSATTTEEELP
jgi:ABC-type Fe3+/spermidine/putrescine transport system ATPase subunit